MKKTLCLILSVAMLASMLFISAGATLIVDAEEYDTCTSGGATVEIKYLQTAPKVDGTVSENEYYEISSDAMSKYYSYYIGDAFGDDQEAKAEQLKDYAKNKMHVYACWDGIYFYFAVTGAASQGEYSCPEAGDSVYLFRYWCMQFGFSKADASGSDRYEIGVGASSDTIGDAYYFGSWGTKTFPTFVEGTNYAAKWDRDNEIVTYEIKVSIQDITGATPANNSSMRFLYMLNQSGQLTGDGSDQLQIQSSYGCAAAKDCGLYLLAVFTGLPDNVELTTAEEVTDPYAEDEKDGYWGKIECRDPDTVERFDLTNGSCTATYKADDNGDRYIRFTAVSDTPSIGGKKLPDGCNADGCKFLAIHYRTTSKNAEWIGLNYTSGSITELDEANIYYNDIELGCDGQWHTIVIDMSSATGWTQFIQNLTFYFFDGAKESVIGESVDIMWVKYYDDMPEFDDEFYPDYSSDTTTSSNPGEETSEGTNAVTSENTSSVTDSEGTKDVSTTVDNGGKTGGNGWIIWVVIGVVVVIAVVVAVVVISKKKKK